VVLQLHAADLRGACGLRQFHLRYHWRVDPKEDIDPLIPLALFEISELFDKPVERLPAGLTRLLRRFGAACHDKGWESAYNEPTIPGSHPMPKGVLDQG